ncbi:MAG: DUF2997 domain-containing protein [Deltaproteobacteria bacterium]|nr:DUF2997 domain-containing protein [Deltaproteobacteria bacterium]
MAEEIRVVIEKNGTLFLEVSGKGGPQCLQVTEALEQEMGKVVERRRTNDFYKQGRIALTNKTRTILKSA